MPARFWWWSVLAGCARLSHRFSRLHISTFCWSARHGGSIGDRLSGPAAVTAARRAMHDVPAYRHMVDGTGDPSPARTPQAWLTQLPVTTKRSYIDRWSLAERCLGGRIPAKGCDLDESAGSTGTPYTWIRGQAELADIHRSLALLSRHLLPSDGNRPLVVLNAFSMGAWATGTNVAVALRAIATVKSCGPDIAKVLGTISLLGPEPAYVVCGYPPFLRSLLDAAAEGGHDLSGITLYGFVGGEGMTEAARRRLEGTFRHVWSAYGASDLDIGVAAETPVSVWLRQQAAVHPDLAAALFGRTDRLPLVFQYDPCDYHIEALTTTAGSRELVVTVTRPMLSPRIRYNVGDEGGTIGFDAAMAACRAVSLDTSESEAEPFRLPFLFVHGRSDQTISFMGANLYPEDVAAGIDAHRAADRLGAFCMELAEVHGDDVRPFIHIEAPEVLRLESVAAELITVIRGHLAANSADYREALLESPRTGDLRVRLWEPGAGPFVANATRIKHRQVLTTWAGAVVPTSSPTLTASTPAATVPAMTATVGAR